MSAPAELTAFVRTEHPRIVRAMTLMLDDRAVAEEIAQEALLRAASRWEHVSHLDSPGGWTHRVAVNLATSQLRRRRLERRSRPRVARGEVAPAADPATAIVVRQALQSLPEPQRRVLVLRHVLQWTVAEIAGLDGSTPDAVRQRLHRARTAMRSHLGITTDHQSVHLTTTELEEISDAR
jgi:RNA polymerase sigma-70 factor (ECF subfamily)